MSLSCPASCEGHGSLLLVEHNKPPMKGFPPPVLWLKRNHWSPENRQPHFSFSRKPANIPTSRRAERVPATKTAQNNPRQQDQSSCCYTDATTPRPSHDLRQRKLLLLFITAFSVHSVLWSFWRAQLSSVWRTHARDLICSLFRKALHLKSNNTL